MRFSYRNLRSRRALAPYLFVGALIGAGFVFGGGLDGPRRPRVPAQPEVIRGVAPGAVFEGHAIVIDGDTLSIARRRIRLAGIDAPERGQRCGGLRGEYDCGDEATRALANLVGIASVQCHAEDRDRWGRIVARCRAGGRDLGAEIVRAGWAKAAHGAPAGYAALEAEARAARRGAWQGAFGDPARWRREHPR